MSEFNQNFNVDQVFTGGVSGANLGPVVKGFEFDDRLQQFMHTWRCTCAATSVLKELQTFGTFAEVKQRPEGNTNVADLVVKIKPQSTFDVRTSREFVVKRFCSLDIVKRVVDVGTSDDGIDVVVYIDQRHKEHWTTTGVLGIGTETVSNPYVHALVCSATKTITYSLTPLTAETGTNIWSSEVTSSKVNCIDVWRRVTILVITWADRTYYKQDPETGFRVTVVEEVTDNSAAITPVAGVYQEYIPFRCNKYLHRTSTIDYVGGGSWITSEGMSYTFPAILKCEAINVVFLQRQRTTRGYYNVGLRNSFSQAVSAQVTNSLSATDTFPTETPYIINQTNMSYNGVMGNAHMPSCLNNAVTGSATLWVAGSNDVNFPGGLTESVCWQASVPTKTAYEALVSAGTFTTVRVAKVKWKYNLYIKKLYKIKML